MVECLGSMKSTYAFSHNRPCRQRPILASPKTAVFFKMTKFDVKRRKIQKTVSFKAGCWSMGLSSAAYKQLELKWVEGLSALNITRDQIMMPRLAQPSHTFFWRIYPTNMCVFPIHNKSHVSE